MPRSFARISALSAAVRCAGPLSAPRPASPAGARRFGCALQPLPAEPSSLQRLPAAERHSVQPPPAAEPRSACVPKQWARADLDCWVERPVVAARDSSFARERVAAQGRFALVAQEASIESTSEGPSALAESRGAWSLNRSARPDSVLVREPARRTHLRRRRRLAASYPLACPRLVATSPASFHPPKIPLPRTDR